MKREIKIHGYNEKYGEFIIHTSDQYNNNTTVKDGELIIHFNKIGQLTFNIYPTNKSFEKLLAIETDIVVFEIEDNSVKQIFTGIVFNINAFSNKNLDIGKTVTCISSHIFFQYRPVSNLIKTDNKEYSYSIDTTKINQGNNTNIISTVINYCILGCSDKADINRYMYNFSKNNLDLNERKNYGFTYNKNDNLSKMFSDVINFYNLELIFEYNFSASNLKDRHTFHFISKDKKVKTKCPKFTYGELLSEYEDELNFSNFANSICLFGENDLKTNMYSSKLIQKYGTFRVNRDCNINNKATLDSECGRQLNIAEKLQHSFKIDFIDINNQVEAGKEIEIENKALGEEKIIFTVEKITFDIDQPYFKKVELKNKKFSHIESMGRRN